MFENKPVIGICPLYDEKKESYWMLPGYMQMLEAAGALPLMMPLTEDADTLAYYLETCDGFIIPGGQVRCLCQKLLQALLNRQAIHAIIVRGAFLA